MKIEELLFNLIITGIGNNNEQTEVFIKKFNKNICNFITKRNKTLLQEAFSSRKYNIARFLIEQDCNLNYQDEEGSTILMYFIFSYNNENKDIYGKLIDLLIEKKVNLNLVDKYGNNVLWYAYGNATIPLNILELLLKNGSNPYHKNKVNKSTYDYVLKDNIEDIKELFKLYVKN